MISAIFAASENHVIGNKNAIPWDLPRDMQYFRDTTKGHTVIMGARTYESMGRALPKRRNIVITDDPNFAPRDAEVVSSIDAAIKLTDKNEESFVIGGASIYRQMIPMCDRVYMTRVHAPLEGDTFVEFDENDPNWKIIKKEHFEPDEQNIYPLTFYVFEKTD